MGFSAGLGRELVLAVLKRGDKVIATTHASSFSKLEDLRAQGADILELDVTSSLEQLREIAKKAVRIHGRVDVLVNNAGLYSSKFYYYTNPKICFIGRLLAGAVEEVSYVFH